MIVLPILFLVFLYFWTNRKKPAQTATSKTVEKINYPRNLAISLGIIIVSLNIFAYDVYQGIGTNLFFVFLTLALFLSTKKYKKNLFTISLSLLVLFLATMAAFRASLAVHNINLWAIAASIAILLFYNAVSGAKLEILFVLNKLKDFLLEIPQQTVLLFQQSKSDKNGGKPIISTILKTTILTLIVVAFFASLLSSADPIFSKIIDTFMEEAMGRVIMSVVAAIAGIVLLTVKIKSKEGQNYQLKIFNFTEVFIPVTALIILFAVFIGVQIKYLFGSHADFSQFNLTYSEYVRKGFNDLLITAFFGSIIAYLIILKNKVIEKSSQITQFKIINSLLIAELFFLLVSAFKRDVMYVQVYGLTRIRIIGGLFLIWLAVLLILLLILGIFKSIKEKHLFVGIYLATIAILVSFNVVNIDKVISQHQPLDSFKDKDYFYINNLSADAFEGWKESITSSETYIGQLINTKTYLNANEQKKLATVKLALISLQEERIYLEKKYGNEDIVKDKYYADEHVARDFNYRDKKRRKWQSYNWTEYQAYVQMTQENSDLFFNKLDELIETIKNFQIIYQVDLYQEERWRLREFEYPFMYINLSYYPQRLSEIDTTNYLKNQ